MLLVESWLWWQLDHHDGWSKITVQIQSCYVSKILPETLQSLGPVDWDVILGSKGQGLVPVAVDQVDVEVEVDSVEEVAEEDDLEEGGEAGPAPVGLSAWELKIGLGRLGLEVGPARNLAEALQAFLGGS